ncbi:MAG TPA: 50S ribosomal protein L25 [Candidatus Angelobacter sp.]|jgi:large subunit ribosomal protein L25|nr:50S ribosomal protein L25 [Candidatus Angelobacter sp.]
MDSISLSARPRSETGRHVHHLRREGGVPAVLYGHKVAPVALTVDAKEMERTWHHAGRTHLVDLRVEGQKSARKALIKDLQIHPRSGRMLHVDFFAVNLREKITSEVPVIVVGESPAVRDRIGQIQQVISTVRVESLPGDLPAQLTVDVSGLTEVDQSITLGEIELPKNVALVHADPSEVVVKIAPVRVREEAAEIELAAEEASPSPPSEGIAPDSSGGQ